jgi:zinc D-Ala-D-Ala carboxypeptidase
MTKRIKLTKNFFRDEFDCKCGCGKNEISPMIVNLCQSLRDAFGKPIFISSGYRCAKRNKAVGGSLTSDHLKGLAVDIACYDAMTRRELVYIALSVGVPTIGVKRDCVHISIGEPARLFTYDS